MKLATLAAPLSMALQRCGTTLIVSANLMPAIQLFGAMLLLLSTLLSA
jgi:hypothetical protein